MKRMSIEELSETYRTYTGINAPYFEDDLSEDDCFDDEYSDTSDIEEKIFVCDSDKIYICLYEEVEEYRISKQTKKKNMTSIWNNLIVILPSGSFSCIQNIATELPKDIKNDAIAKKIIESSNTNNSNNIHLAPPPVSEVKVGKVEPPKFKKLEKSSKKKIKKQRQKGRKKNEPQGKIDGGKDELELVDELEEESGETFLDNKSRSVSKTASFESIQDEVSNKQNESAEDIDLMSENAAFFNNVYKKNEKKISNKKEEKPVKASQASKSSKETVKGQKPEVKNVAMKPNPAKENLHNDKKLVEAKHTSCSSSSLNDDFNLVSEKLKRPVASRNQYIDGISFGEKGINLLMNEQLPQAIHFFTKAISVNIYDLRHHLNRSFCYIRSGSYELAIQDAQFVIDRTKENSELVKAKFHAGRAYCGLQNFQKAESFLDEAYNFSQADPLIQRELMRVKMLQLLHMGFREKDVLEAFKDHQSVAEVIAVLTEITITEENDYEYESECDEEDIYNSDDEENPSLTRILSNMLNDPLYAPKPINSAYSNTLKNTNSMQQQSTTSNRQMYVPIEARRTINTIPQKIPVSTKEVNDKAIWVGNTTPEITENMLRNKFMKFGKIVSIFRRPNENYTFINFESAKSVTELLSSIAVIEVNGHKLFLKAANRGKR